MQRVYQLSDTIIQKSDSHSDVTQVAASFSLRSTGSSHNDEAHNYWVSKFNLAKPKQTPQFTQKEKNRSNN